MSFIDGRPDQALRREIWQRLLPAKLPIAGDLNLDVLSRAELTGGEIKNVVLNAARLAAQRLTAGPVTTADFDEAVAMEIDGRLAGRCTTRIGFTP